jgi:phage gp29-like protein
MKQPRLQRKELAAPVTVQPPVKKRTDGYYQKIAPKATSRVRQDIASMTKARQQKDNVDTPKQILLQKLYIDILQDALLYSQVNNRKMISVSAPFTIMAGDKADDDTTAMLKSFPWFRELIGHIWDTIMTGPALVEFVTDKAGLLKPVCIPKQNLIPEKGMLLLDETQTTGIDYRNAKEYGSWLLEFGDAKDFGLLNKAIPHVLFKRFAQSCWSELCEIYGIPPRYMKTNTQDPVMLTRAESMMRDMGAAAWFIIDESEEFDFAKGADTNGDVYGNLIRLCNNELSLLVSGAVIGQDTKNGNESKEKVSVDQLMRLGEADKRYIEGYINSSVMPALYLIGLVPEGLLFSFDPQEDTQELYTRTVGFMQYFEVDPEWVKNKFGIEVTKPRQSAGGTGNFQQPGQNN